MIKFRKLFGAEIKPIIIGMIHVGALPGSPLYGGSVNNIISQACKEVEIYLRHNIHGILVENMHDVPYVQSKHLGPETTAAMTRICTEVKRIVPETVPCGIQVLASANKEALAIASACSFDFIRAEGYVFSHIADEGFTDATAGVISRYRKHIGAENVLIFADIKKKHSSHAITDDVSVVETAKAAEFFLADGLVLTGKSTGSAADAEELEAVKKNCSLPILIGSGVTRDNLENYSIADGLIIGSYFKKVGKWSNDLDESRVKSFMQQRDSL